MIIFSKKKYEEKTDEELVKLSLENKDFFAYIVDRYEEKLFRYVRRITNVPQSEILDILQEIFIKVYQNLNDFDYNLKFSSWIYRIAHNQTISIYRKDKSRPHGNSVDIDEEILKNIANDFDILAEADLKILKLKISKVLEKIDEKYKEIILLRFFEDKNYEEISDILKIPMGTVATLISRAKKQMKKELEKENFLKKYE